MAEVTDREPVLTVDYADVLRQAVENERWKVLREVTNAVSAIPTHVDGRSWDRTSRPAEDYKRDLMAALDKIARGGDG